MEQCTHEHRDACVRTLSNGHRQYGTQCSVCGQWKAVSAVIRSTWGSVREYDASIKERYWKQREAAWSVRHQEFLVRQQAEQEARWGALNAYYLTPEWRAKRARRLKLDKGFCQARLAVCITFASQVHHKTYTHLYNEPMWDLESVCVPCHEELTDMDRERRRGIYV